MGEGGKPRSLPAPERLRGAPWGWRSGSTASSTAAELAEPAGRLAEARAERVERGSRAPRRARRALSGRACATPANRSPRIRSPRSGGAGSTPSARPRSTIGRLGRSPTASRRIRAPRWSIGAAASGVAAVAALASSGDAGAGAVRGCAAPPRAGRARRDTGPLRRRRVAIASGRLADDAARAAVAQLGEAGTGVVLADWAALAREPSMARSLRARRAHRPAAVPAPRAPGVRARGAGFASSTRLGRSGDRAGAEGPRTRNGRLGALGALCVALYAALSARAVTRDAARAVASRAPGEPSPLARRSRAVACGCSRSSGSLRWERVRHRALPSASYPRRRRISSDPRPSSPTATAMRRAGDF